MLKLIANFMEMWVTASQEDQHLVARAWVKIADDHQGSGWQFVSASISAVVATLRQAGIQPLWPTTWVTATGARICWTDAPSNRAASINAVRKGFEHYK